MAALLGRIGVSIVLGMKSGMEQPLHGAIALEMLLHNFGYVSDLDAAVPGIIGHHFDGWAGATLPQTFAGANKYG